MPVSVIRSHVLLTHSLGNVSRLPTYDQQSLFDYFAADHVPDAIYTLATRLRCRRGLVFGDKTHIARDGQVTRGRSHSVGSPFICTFTSF
jgi:hypothetical protein